MTSPYAATAYRYRESGHHVMPVGPGTKIPGIWSAGQWNPMPGWQKHCDAQPIDLLHTQWERFPDAGVCVAHGRIIGLDVDTDRKDVSDAIRAVVAGSPCQRRGAKGWLGYYRPGDGLDGLTARVRWYDGEKVAVELLLHGTQSVLPPTIHPGTGQPYKWITPDTLESVEASDLPAFTGADLAAIDRALGALGITRQAPRRVSNAEYERPSPTAHDLEKPFGRSLNDRAMEPDALDRWWPALMMPKSRQRGRGAWEAVPFWRTSGSGRPINERNPNLKATPSGIVDFGADRSYTPLDVIMAARDCSFQSAAEWLKDFVRAEEGASLEEIVASLPAPSGRPIVADGDVDPGARSATRFSRRSPSKAKPRQVEPTSEAEFMDAFPADVPPFPIQDYERDLTGILREVTLYIDESANMRSEQGAFGAALAALGTIMGRMVEVQETGLRTNIYVIGTAESGAGKSSAMGAMLKMMGRCGVDDRLAGSDFTSGSAILKEIGSGGARLFSVDEFGDVIRRVLAPRAASHERDIGRILKDMYSAASGFYRGKAYATQERQDIAEPHLCIYGVSTHEAFWESIDGRSFSDGLLARFVMIPIGATETQTPNLERGRAVADMLTDMLASCKGAGNLGRPTCQGVTFGAGVWDQWMTDRTLFQRHSERAARMKRPGAPSIIQRICENAMKIAMISAMGRKPVEPQISMEDYELGLDVAHWSAISMISAIDRYYVENSNHRDLNRIVEFIETAGPNGRVRTEIIRAFKGIFVNAMAAKSILEAMLETQEVIEWRPSTQVGHRKPTWYVSARHAHEFMARQQEVKDAAE